MLYPYKGRYPEVDSSVFVAPGTRIIGEVRVGRDSSIWFNSVLRGDETSIHIGEQVNVQDNCTLHSYSGFPLVLEDQVSIGHNVVLHGCLIRKGSLIGMGSIVLDGAEIGEECFIGANTLIPTGKKIPPRSMVMGSPGKVVRELTEQDLHMLRLTTEVYCEKAKEYRDEYRNLPPQSS